MELARWLAVLVAWSRAGAAPTTKAPLDPKRRNDLVDEAFMEQKDVLLEMLEAKLKEVRDKKKKKQDNLSPLDAMRCESAPSNLDLKLKAQGLSAVGDAEATLTFGQNGSLALQSTGVVSVGRASLALDVGDAAVHIPGLNHLFSGAIVRGFCDKRNKTDDKVDPKERLTVSAGNAGASRRHGINATEVKPFRSSRINKAASKSAAAVTNATPVPEPAPEPAPVPAPEPAQEAALGAAARPGPANNEDLDAE